VDQFHWAHRVRRLGLGPPAIARRQLSADRLAQAIAALRDNDILAERAAEVGARLRADLVARPDPAERALS
jgi:UDP:flavonoid glycosyltransferase YjiC (YdhE family)